MQADRIERIKVYRPYQYQTTEAQPEIAESALNIYKMSVDALSFTEQRASFSLEHLD